MVRYRHFTRDSLNANNVRARAEALNAAGAELDRALAAAPRDVTVLLTAAEAALQRGDSEQARRYFDRIPADPEKRRSEREEMSIRLVQGLIELSANQVDDAVAAWQRGLIASGGTDVDLTWRMAYVLLSMGRIDEAEPLLEQHRRLTGGSEPTGDHMFLEGVKLLRTNHPQQAQAALLKALPRIGPGLSSKVRYTLGQCYEALRDETSALQQYALAAKEEPKWSAPRLAHARLLGVRRPLDAAIALNQSLNDMPKDPVVQATIARAELQRQVARPPAGRDWSEFDKLVAQLKATSPSSTTLALLQAERAAASGNPTEAAALLEQAVRRDKREADLWVAWAAALIRLNRTEDAVRVLEQGSAPDAAGDSATLRVARARLLTALGHGKQARDALIVGWERLRADEQPLIWAELGNTHQQRHEVDEARKAYNKWAELLPEDPQPRLVLHEMALTEGRTDEAHKQLAALDRLGNKMFHMVASVQELLRETPEGFAEAAKDRTERYAKAEALIDKLEADYPQERYAYVLRGLLYERRGDVDRAIAAYERSLDHNGGQAAATRLVALYTKLGRFNDLETLRRRQGESADAMTKLTAVEALRLGNREMAEKMAQQLVDGQPDSLDARLWQARVLNTLGKPEDAERVLRDLVARHADEPGPWLALLFFQISRNMPRETTDKTIDQIRLKVKKTDLPEFLLAQCYRASGDFAKAEPAYKAALAKWPDDPRVVRGAYAFYEATDRADAAEATLRDYLKRNPEQRWAIRDLAALISARPKDPQAAKAAWEQAWDMVKDAPRGGDMPEDRLTRALILARSPDRARQDEAIKILEKLMEDLPADRPVAVTSRNFLVRLYQDRGEKDKALEVSALNATDMGNPMSVAVYTLNLIDRGRLDKAEAQIARLAAIAPNDLMTIKLRALLLQARNRTPEAIALLERLITEREGDPEGEGIARSVLELLGGADGKVLIDAPEAAERIARHVAERWPASGWMLGRILARKGRVDEAIDLCGLAVKNSTPGSRDAAEAGRVAMALAATPGASEAVITRVDALLDEVRKRDPNNADLLLMTALLRHSQGRFEEELKLYNDVEATRPTNPVFLNNKAWTLSESLGKPQQAIEVIDALIGRLGDNDPQILDTRGVILTRLNRLPEAVKDLERVVKAQPDNPVYAFHLARAYDRMGDAANFRKAMDAARNGRLTVDRVDISEREDFKRLSEK